MNEHPIKNCVYCDYFRFERRHLELKNRTDFCYTGSSYWPAAETCPYYRMRSCFLKINGIEPEERRYRKSDD
jgi:hypothetical protein